MVALVVPLHMGALHPMESLVMAALALGPFVVLATVVTIVSRGDRREQPPQHADAGQAARREPDRRDAATSTMTETAAPHSVQQ